MHPWLGWPGPPLLSRLCSPCRPALPQSPPTESQRVPASPSPKASTQSTKIQASLTQDQEAKSARTGPITMTALPSTALLSPVEPSSVIGPRGTTEASQAMSDLLFVSNGSSNQTWARLHESRPLN